MTVATAAAAESPARRGTSSRGEVWYVAISDFPRGLGSTARARSVCTALRRAGRETRLLIPYAIGHAANDRVSGIVDGLPFEYMNGSTERPRGARRVAQAKLRFGLRFVRRLISARRSLSVVFLYNMSAIDAWPALLAARLLNIGVVLDLTDDWHDPSIGVRTLGWARYCYQLISRALEGIVFRGSDRIIVVTRYMERRLAQYAAKLVRLAMLFDADRFAHAPIVRVGGADDFTILYAGSISSVEGMHVLLESIGRLDATRVTLHLVGNAAYGESIENYRTMARRLGVDQRVVFHPPVDRDCYASYLRGADLLVIPRTTGHASQAGFPYKLGEYLASGTPTVVTRFGDVEEYFVDRRDCLMCAPDDPAALAAALQYAIAHVRELAPLGRSGQARVRELFSFEKGASVLERLLDDLEGAPARS